MKRTTSPARAAASRANGLKSRGPVTPQGKYNSSRNATRHGILARFLVMNGELPDLFEDLYARFHADLHPRNDIERALVEEMVTSWWRKQRVWGMESARIQHQIKMNEAMGRAVPVDDPATRTALAVGDLADNSRALDLYLRYETRYERQFHRALSRLLDLRSRYPESGDDSPSPASNLPKEDTNLPNDPEQPIENTPQPPSGPSGSPHPVPVGRPLGPNKDQPATDASSRNAPVKPLRKRARAPYILTSTMTRYFLAGAAAIAAFAFIAVAQESGPYKILKTAKVGGIGGFDYVDNDQAGRRLYVARSGQQGARITVFDLDTLAPVGEIPGASAHGAVVSPKTGHGIASSKPPVMFDAKTLAPIKTIEVGGNPDGMMYDAFNDRVWIFSHALPHATVINPADGSVVGTLDLGGQPEQAASDGKGHIYVDIEDKENIAVVDAKTLTVTAHYDIAGKGGTCAGLALDVKNNILFAACRNPANMVILNAGDGKVITTLPLGAGTDGAAFNPDTMEAFSSQGDGTLTVIKENSPTSFVVEQTVKTMPTAKTLTLDRKTGHIVLIGAEFGPAPVPPPAGGRAGRGPLVPDSFTILVVGK